MRRLIWMICLLGLAAACGPIDQGQADPPPCYDPSPGCSKQEAEAFEQKWEGQGRNPAFRGATAGCVEGYDVVHHTNGTASDETRTDVCRWQTGKWSGGVWVDRSDSGEWRPLCICVDENEL